MICPSKQEEKKKTSVQTNSENKNQEQTSNNKKELTLKGIEKEMVYSGAKHD